MPMEGEGNNSHWDLGWKSHRIVLPTCCYLAHTHPTLFYIHLIVYVVWFDSCYYKMQQSCESYQYCKSWSKITQASINRLMTSWCSIREESMLAMAVNISSPTHPMILLCWNCDQMYEVCVMRFRTCQPLFIDNLDHTEEVILPCGMWTIHCCHSLVNSIFTDPHRLWKYKLHDTSLEGGYIPG